MGEVPESEDELSSSKAGQRWKWGSGVPGAGGGLKPTKGHSSLGHH